MHQSQIEEWPASDPEGFLNLFRVVAKSEPTIDQINSFIVSFSSLFAEMDCK